MVPGGHGAAAVGYGDTHPIADHGEAPTVREIAAALGLSGPSSVLYQLRRLAVAGILRRAGAGSRE
ncbi:LexA family protein [Streptomyces sp. NPDC004685]